jgi:hypothetical protein
MGLRKTRSRLSGPSAAIAWRTHWRPLHLGELLLASAGLYWRHWRIFAPIGLAAIPIIGGFDLLTRLLTGDAGRRLDDKVGHSGLHGALGESSVTSAPRSPRRSSPCARSARTPRPASSSPTAACGGGR